MSERSPITEKCWPDETPEELYAKLVVEHGKTVARIIWAAMQPDAEQHKHRNPAPAEGWYDNRGKQTARGFRVSTKHRQRHTRGR